MSSSIVSHIALEQLSARIESYDEALEAYTVIHRILDSFGRILYNLKAHFVGFDKRNFKRSELRFYHESKKLAIANLFKKQYFDKDLMVPIPSGMKISYAGAVDIIDELFKKLDIGTTVDTLISYLQEKPLSDPSLITKKIANLDKLHLEVELRKVFSSKKTMEVPLHTVVSGFQEIVSLDKKILAYETVFGQVKIICEKLGRIEKLIDDIVTDLEHREEIDRRFVKSLHLLVKTAAFQLDAFGVLIAEAQRIEVNFTFVLNKLVTAAARN